MSEAPALAGLAPIVGPGARVLILGSMPGGRSLALGQYYANPGNRFWRVAGALFGLDPGAAYAARTAHLVRRGVALWDVLARCRRAGSLDASIVPGSEAPNDFGSFFDEHPAVRMVALNGGAAAKAFARLVPDEIRASRIVLELPSTSGANAACPYDRLLGRWSELVPHAGLDSPIPKEPY